MTTPIPDGSVIITPVQMYTEQVAMRHTLDKLAMLIDPALSDLRHDTDEASAKIVLHGNRLTAIETKLNVAWGAIVLLVGAIGGVAAWLGH